MCTVRTNADNLDGGFEFLFQEDDIILELLGELVLGGELRHVGLPTRKGLVDRFDTTLDVIGEVAGLYTVYLIGGAGLDGVEAIEDIALHHDELGDTIDHDAVAQGYEVDPTTTTLTTGDCTILMAKVTDALARLVEQFGGEWTGTDTGAVGLHDAIDLANLIGANAQTGAGSCTDGVAGGDEGIGTEVYIEHGALSTLAEDGLASTQGFVDFVFGINQMELAEIIHSVEPLIFYFFEI